MSSLVLMPIQNKRFSVPLFRRRLVHISCADETALWACEALWRVGGNPQPPSFQPRPARAQLQSPGCKWVNKLSVLLISKMKSTLITSALREDEAMQSPQNIQSRKLQKLWKRDYRGIKELVGEGRRGVGGSCGHERALHVALSQERIAVLYLSVPCAHILIKHISTDLEHVMTEQQPVNNTEQTAISMRRHTKTGRGNRTQYPEHENVDRFCCGLGQKYHKSWRERASWVTCHVEDRKEI